MMVRTRWSKRGKVPENIFQWRYVYYRQPDGQMLSLFQQGRPLASVERDSIAAHRCVCLDIGERLERHAPPVGAPRHDPR